MSKLVILKVICALQHRGNHTWCSVTDTTPCGRLVFQVMNVGERDGTYAPLKKVGPLMNLYKNSLNMINSLKVPERYEKCLRVSSSVKEKSLSAPPSGRVWATS